MKNSFSWFETPSSNKMCNLHLSHVESQKAWPTHLQNKAQNIVRNHKTYLSSIVLLHHTSARDDILCLQFCYCSRKQTPFSFFMHKNFKKKL